MLSVSSFFYAFGLFLGLSEYNGVKRTGGESDGGQKTKWQAK